MLFIAGTGLDMITLVAMNVGGRSGYHDDRPRGRGGHSSGWYQGGPGKHQFLSSASILSEFLQ